MYILSIFDITSTYLISHACIYILSIYISIYIHEIHLLIYLLLIHLLNSIFFYIVYTYTLIYILIHIYTLIYNVS